MCILMHAVISMRCFTRMHECQLFHLQYQILSVTLHVSFYHIIQEEKNIVYDDLLCMRSKVFLLPYFDSISLDSVGGERNIPWHRGLQLLSGCFVIPCSYHVFFASHFAKFTAPMLDLGIPIRWEYVGKTFQCH